MDRDHGRRDRRVAKIAGEQEGVASSGQLRSAGLTYSAVSRRIAAGHLHRHHKGVYAVGHTAVALEGRFRAAVLACGRDALLSHYSACALHGMVDWDEREIEVVLRDSTPRTHPGLTVHRTRRLTDADITLCRGIRTTTTARSLVDLAQVVNEQQLKRAVRRGLGLRVVSLPQIAAALNRAGRRRGAVALRNILAAGHHPTRSDLEDIVLDLLLTRFAPPDVNKPLRLPGRIVIPDIRFAAQRLIVEVDSRQWHDDPVARADDAERQAALEAHGERVVRVTYEQAVRRPAQTLARIEAAGAPLRDPGA